MIGELIKETLKMASVDIFYQRDGPWFFQQDGAPAHKAKLIKEWFPLFYRAFLVFLRKILIHKE